MKVQLGRMKHRFLIGLLLCMFLACTDEPKKPSPPQDNKQLNKPKEQTKPVVIAPEFDEESAYNYVKAQVDFGPRVPNSPEHVKCKDYFVETFTELGLVTEVQSMDLTAYNGKTLKSFNIIAKYDPENETRIMLCAHWDSRPYAENDTKRRTKPILGANDGASGVGVLLEIAKTINQSTDKPKIGIDFVLFDAEDYGKPSEAMNGKSSDSWCLGSQYWSKNLPASYIRPQYGILLDMVGASDAIFPKDRFSVKFAPKIVEKVWAAAAKLGHEKYFVPIFCPGELTDDHVYVNYIAKIPTIDIIHYDPKTYSFGAFHHTHADNMNIIDKKTLNAVGSTLLHIIYNQ